jgi:transposase InsO family protein
MHPTWSVNAWKKVHIDVVTVAKSDEGYRYIIAARDDLTGWIEVKMLRNKNKEEWIGFIESHIVARYGPPEVIVSDNGEMNSAEAFEFCENYGIQLRLTSDYHPQANGIVERGHKPIVDALMKYCQDKPEDWPKYFYSALWADRVTTRRSTGYSPFFLLYGYHCPFSIERIVPTYRQTDWKNRCCNGCQE